MAITETGPSRSPKTVNGDHRKRFIAIGGPANPVTAGQSVGITEVAKTRIDVLEGRWRANRSRHGGRLNRARAQHRTNDIDAVVDHGNASASGEWYER